MITKSKAILAVSFFFLFNFSTPAQDAPCRQLLAEIETAPRQFWAFDQNVFSNSIDSTLVSGATWLSLVQGGKVLLLQNQFFTPGFVVTLPMDIGLTLTSHFLALESFTALEGSTPRQNFWIRAGLNTLQGSIVIPLFWALFNQLNSMGITDSRYAITPITCLGAAGLCAVVYPTLQRTKQFLFKERPLARDRERLGALEEGFAQQVKLVLEKSKARADNLQLEPSQVEALSLSMLATLIGSYDYEDAVEKTPGLNQEPRVRKLLDEIKDLDAKRSQKLSLPKKLWYRILKKSHEDQITYKIIQGRHQLIRELLALEEGFHFDNEIRRLLALGDGFTEDESIAFHREIQTQVRDKKIDTYIHSFIDQMISVGVAGGLFLYGVNHWAATGETPWFISWFLN